MGFFSSSVHFDVARRTIMSIATLTLRLLEKGSWSVSEWV